MSLSAYGGSARMRSKARSRRLRAFITGILQMVALLCIPREHTFASIARQAAERASTKSAVSAPRLRASIPRAPVPAYKSSTLESTTADPMTSKIACRTLSLVGLVCASLGAFRAAPFTEPPPTRGDIEPGRRYRRRQGSHPVLLTAYRFLGIVRRWTLAQVTGRFPKSLHVLAYGREGLAFQMQILFQNGEGDIARLLDRQSVVQRGRLQLRHPALPGAPEVAMSPQSEISLRQSEPILRRHHRLQALASGAFHGLTNQEAE